MMALLLTVVALLLFVLGLAIMVVCSVTSLALLQRRGRWRGRRSYLSSTAILIVTALLLGQVATSANPSLERFAEEDIGTGLIWLLSALTCGLVWVAVCSLLPRRQRAPKAGHGRASRLAAAVLRVLKTVLLWATVPLALGFGWWAALDESIFGGVFLFLVVGFSIAVSLGALAGAAGYVASRLTPPRLEDTTREDPRAPVLYLRSFGQEESWFSRDANGQGLTVEQFLGAAVRERLGPLVALGSPTDRLAPEGSVRIYCRDEDWRSAAERLMCHMRCALLIPASTVNVRWEVCRLVELGLIDRLFICVPPSCAWLPLTPPRHRLRSALGSVLRYYFSSKVGVDDDVISSASVAGPPLAFTPLPELDVDGLSEVLRSAGLDPLPGPVPGGSIIGFEGRSALLLATDLTTAQDYVGELSRHLLAAGGEGPVAQAHNGGPPVSAAPRQEELPES